MQLFHPHKIPNLPPFPATLKSDFIKYVLNAPNTMAAIAYNLKKYLNYNQKKAIVLARFKTGAQMARHRNQAVLISVLACIKVEVILNQWEVKR